MRISATIIRRITAGTSIVYNSFTDYLRPRCIFVVSALASFSTPSDDGNSVSLQTVVTSYHQGCQQRHLYICHDLHHHAVFTPTTLLLLKHGSPRPIRSSLERYAHTPSFTCSPDLKDNTVTLTIFQAIAISSTLYRLFRRYRIQRLWWDDYVVVIPLVMDIVYTVIFCLQFRDSGESSSVMVGFMNDESIPRRCTDPSLEKVLEIYWLQIFFLLTIVWYAIKSLLGSRSLSRIVRSTRIVLALSLGRIFPSSHRARKSSIVLAGIFLLAYVLSVVSPLFTCGGGAKSWNNQCTTSNGVILRGAVMSGGALMPS